MRSWALAALAYLVASLVFTLPMPLHLGTEVWGDRFDAWTTMWLIWMLGEHGWSETTDLIFFPHGYSLWSFGHVALQLIGAPFVALGVSPVAVYNGLLLFAFTATGLAAHALGLRLSGSHWGGLICGTVFAFNPFTYGEMSAGCVELVGAFFIPLTVLGLVRLSDEPTLKNAGFFAGSLALCGPFNWYYTAFLAMFTVAFWCWRALVPTPNRTRVLALIAAGAFVAALTNLPLITKARQETPERGVLSAETFSEEAWDVSNRIADGTLPLEDLDEALLRRHDTMQVAINSTSLINLAKADFPANPLDSTPGRMAYALGLFGLVAAGRRARPWALLAGGFTVLTLGPFVQLDATPPLPGWSLADPLPYHGLYNELPFFSKAYRPYRLGVVVVLCLGVLGALGFAALRGRRRPLAATVLLLAATQPHWSGTSARGLADARIPEVYERFSELEPGAVIELPLHYQPVTPANARFQYNQIAHGLPLLNCNQLIRRTDLMRFQGVVAENALLQILLDLGRSEPPYAFTEEDAGALMDQGFRYLVAHDEVAVDDAALAGFVGDADRLRQPAWSMLHEAFGAPVLEGDGARVYALARVGGTWSTAWEEHVNPWSALELPMTLVSSAEGVRLGPGGRWALWLLAEGEGEVWLGEQPLDLPEGAWAFRDVTVDEALLTVRGGSVQVRLASLQRAP